MNQQSAHECHTEFMVHLLRRNVIGTVTVSTQAWRMLKSAAACLYTMNFSNTTMPLAKRHKNK